MFIKNIFLSSAISYYPGFVNVFQVGVHTGKARGVLKPGTGTGNTTDITLLHNQRWLAHGNPSSCSLSLLFTNPRSARTTILRYICCTPAEQCTCSQQKL